MRDTRRKLIARTGAMLMVTGAALLVSAGTTSAQAATRPAHHGSQGRSSASLPCPGQAGLNDPTNTGPRILQSYSFAIEHGGITTNVCSLTNKNVQAGDIVTATFTLHKGVSQATQISLVSYLATDEDTSQTMFDCASFGVSNGSCSSTTANALTVRVPSCGFQVDLIYGAPLSAHLKGSYFSMHTWISGAIGDLSSEVICTHATPTPSLPNTGGTPTPGGVLSSITTPSTGAGSGAESALGLSLILLGGSAVVYGGRRFRAEVV